MEIIADMTSVFSNGQAEQSREGLRLGKLKAALFLLLPNDIVWSWLLTSQEREQLLAANICDNDGRADFTPEDYQKGNSFESSQSRQKHVDGKWILRFLGRYRPGSVLECGPGSGFHSRSIVEQPFVERYAGIDVNRAFVEYLEGRLKPYQDSKGLEFRMFLGDIKQIDLPAVDAVIFSSSLHHIPDRQEIFAKLAQLVKPGGFVFCIEPTHYLPRLKHLWCKVCLPGYLRGMGDGSVPVATHNFCTWREFKQLAPPSGLFRICEVDYDGYRGTLVPRVLAKLSRMLGLGWPVWLRTSFPVRLFSTRMMIVFQRL